MNRARAFTPRIQLLVYLTICCALIVALQSITLGQEQTGTSTQATETTQPSAASELPDPCETAMCQPGPTPPLPKATPPPPPCGGGPCELPDPCETANCHVDPLPVASPTPIPSPTPVPSPVPPPAPTAPSCNNVVVANVVAFDQVYTYNRFGAFNPAGMMFALRRDVIGSGPGNIQLRPNKRPRPIVLRVNEGDCLQVNFTNLLATTRPNNDSTFTRYASIHVNGLDYVNGPNADDGANVGKNTSTLVAPGDSRTYKWYAAKEGQYLLYSMGAPSGGEGDGGQLDLGLFGSVNVEPKGAKWYRSQVTAAQLQAASSPTRNLNNTPQINYEARYPDGTPVLNMLQGNEIIYTDVNALITGFTENCLDAPPSSTCGQNFREFTVIFHDEIKAVQAFPELDQEVFHGVRDGFAINYGSGGMGAIVLANRKKVGPAANCAECKYEEFFLESHPNNDPALIVRKDAAGKAVEVLFPDDPANVVHSYLGDPVRFRNLHAGPKETHVFHLHAHQWLQSPRDENSTYLDSQTISPGAAFTYEINYGGGGNRNFTAGDAIFHCHLYPHFAQGMWELWRNHDVFEAGTPDRNLPDGEIAGGTPNPAIVPLPDRAMPPMPTPTFKGYPFYIPAQAGHRSPQPPLDIEVNGGLPRHRVLQGQTIDGKPAVEPALLNDPVASRVASQSTDPFLFFFARVLTSAQIELLPQGGTAAEVNAMNFHQGTDNGSGQMGVQVLTKYGWPARGYQSFTPSGVPQLFLVNGQTPKPGAPYADPCSPTSTATRAYRAAYIQFDMTVNRAGWHDRQARITTLEADAIPTLNGTRKPEPLFFRVNSGECVTFAATNLVPSVLNLDDFQIFTPTDIIGQHIHLVKFDVTSSDGAGNGWNYEDGGFSPGEVRERIAANNAFQQAHGGTQILTPQPHPVFGAGPNNDFLGAQTTVQRWWADPLLNNQGQDRTIRTVFTHDHFSPSSHQHHGLYGALVVEPPNSQWAGLDNQPLGGRYDGGPTSYAANIIPGPGAAPDQKRPYREFNLAFGDFAIVYTADLKPVNPPGFMEAPLPIAIEQPPLPMPEAISAADPGTQLVNYRNEPIPLRIGQETAGGFVQRTDPSGDMANVFNSNLHGDPFTPLLTAFENERVQVRLIQGAQEEQHVFNIHGVKWLFEPSSPNSGFRNGQQIGISEHFEFEINPSPLSPTVIGGANAVDRLYSSAATDNLWDGQWGILRTFQGAQALVTDQITGQPFTLTPLPGTPQTQRSSAGSTATFNSVCPPSAPVRSYSVSAWAARDLLPGGKLEYNKRFGIADPNAIIFIENAQYSFLKNGWARPEPLILRAAAGECVQVTLTNRLPAVVPESDSWNHMPAIINHFNFNQVKTSNRVGLNPQLVAYDLATSDGARVGRNPDTTVGPGSSITYTWYAGENTVDTDGRVVATPMEFGATGLRDMGDVIKHASHGATGMLIIEPAGSNWISDYTFTNGSGFNASANVFLGGSSQINFREHAVIYQDDLSVQQNGVPLKNIGGEDDAEDTGFKAFNYRSEPIWARMGLQVTDVPDVLNDVDQKNVLSSTKTNPGCGTSPCGDPETMVYTSIAGTPTRFRVIQSAGHPRQHGFTIFGHHWQFEPWTANSTVQGTNPLTFEVGSYSGIGPTRHDNILTNAGGLFSKPGDYLYRTQESFQFTNGLWGIFRVTPR